MLKKHLLVTLEDIFFVGLVIGIIGLILLIILFSFSLVLKNTDLTITMFILIIITCLVFVISGTFFFIINYIITKRFPHLHIIEQITSEPTSTHDDTTKIPKKNNDGPLIFYFIPF